MRRAVGQVETAVSEGNLYVAALYGTNTPLISRPRNRCAMAEYRALDVLAKLHIHAKGLHAQLSARCAGHWQWIFVQESPCSHFSHPPL